MDVAASATNCADAAPVLVMGLADDDREVVRKSKEKLERCGKAAVPAYAEVVRAGSPAARVAVALLFAQVAPREALAPLADAAGGPDAEVRAAIRRALAQAAKSADASGLSALLRAPQRTREWRLEIVRALSTRLADVRADADAALSELLAGDAPMRTRYLSAGPLAELARAGHGPAAVRLSALLTHDPETAVRAHAAEVALGTSAMEGALVTGASDPEPRVRAAALMSIAANRAKQGERPARARLADDPWTFVRTAAAGAIAALPPSGDADDALARAIEDPSPRVRTAAIAGLAAHRAASKIPLLIDRLDGRQEDLDVKIAITRALAVLCAATSTEILTTLADRGASAVADDDERSLGLAAIEALGHLHPPDLQRRLTKARAADANAYAKRAAEQALHETTVCR
jgi:hypothetical protein